MSGTLRSVTRIGLPASHRRASWEKRAAVGGGPTHWADSHVPLAWSFFPSSPLEDAAPSKRTQGPMILVATAVRPSWWARRGESSMPTTEEVWIGFNSRLRTYIAARSRNQHDAEDILLKNG